MREQTVIVSAPAKVNLTLDVLARRPDGYHELSTIMQTVSLSDSVTVAVAPATETTVELTCDKPFVPTDDRNIAVKAAKLFLAEVNQAAHVRIAIAKNIPVGAGMGGGSTDAAAVLRALDALLETKLSAETMNRLAKSIGADVPFLIDGGCALAKGIGEALQNVAVFTGMPMVLCKPRASAATKAIFGRLRVDAIEEHPDTLGALEAVETKNLSAVAFRLFNVLEPVTTEICPVVDDYHRALLKAGALGAVMTGSGTAVFGIFSDLASAERAANVLKSQCDQVWVMESIAENPPVL